jgi:hypothetical protein
MLGMQLQNVARRSISEGSGASNIDIAGLFSQNDAGCFYDINDSSTLKEDIAGTTSASIDSPVGKILCKVQNQDMVATADLNRATLRRKAKDSARRNQSRYTETAALFVSQNNVSHTVGATSSPLSYQSRKTHTMTATGSGSVVSYVAVSQTSTLTGTNQTVSCYLKVTPTGSNPCEGILFHNVNNVGSVLFNFDTETVTGTNNDLVSGSMTAVANHTGWYKCVFTVPRHGDSYFIIMTDGGSLFGNGVSVGNAFNLQGFQREIGSSATEYQAVYSQSYEEYGKANVDYLRLLNDSYTTQNMLHDSQDLIMIARIDPSSSDDTNRPIFSKGRDDGSTYYKLSCQSNNFKLSVSSANFAQVAIPSGIATVRAEYIPAADTGRVTVNGTTVHSNNQLNSQATDFGLYDEAALGAQITTNGSTPTVSNSLTADLYSFVLFTKTLTDQQIQNIEHTMRSQSGDL